jgi:osomolarity two-component system sensor histidine kinase TcsA
MVGGDKEQCIKQVIDEAITAHAVRTIGAMCTRQSTSWSGRVIPIFNENALLYIVLDWQGQPMISRDNSIPTSGLSTDEAFRILVQTVKDYAIFLLDTKGNVATWNTGAQLLKGYRKEDIIGKHFSVFYGEDDLKDQKPAKELEICLQEGRVEDEGWRYRQDGSRFWANVIITAIYKDGLHVGFGKVTRDLTERKAAESRLIAVYEESEKLKSDFLANMSHEIRTPMHGMLSACGLLLDSPLTESQKDLANIIGESGHVLLQLINDILDYSKLASGNFSINSDVVGVASIINSVVRSAQTTLRPTVHFELDLRPELPKSAQGDPLRYRQIVQNIVGNAAKFTDRGSIRVQASLVQEDDESYTILTEVADTGIGIPDRSTKNLFTPFTQFDNTTIKRYKGTGLGLSIAKSLTELMDGQIGYRPNCERQGSIFWFTVKLKKIKSLCQIQRLNTQLAAMSISKPMSPCADVDPVERIKAIAPKKRLLLVEDNLINQKVMLGILRALGFKNVKVATDGVQAISQVLGSSTVFDLVLMDINMPFLDGHDATTEIRKSGNKVPIVAMTAYALKGDRELCLEKGMDDYIPKPVSRNVLVRVLLKWLPKETDYRNGIGPA